MSEMSVPEKKKVPQCFLSEWEPRETWSGLFVFCDVIYWVEKRLGEKKKTTNKQTKKKKKERIRNRSALYAT